MDAKTPTLIPAVELAKRSPVRQPHESAEYRAARMALLQEEYELRRHIARVAEMRRGLPPGGEVTGDYRFEGVGGPTDFAGLFGDKEILVAYSFMYGPERDRPCPMCTNLLGPLAANARDLDQQVSVVAVARSPIQRLMAFSQERGWQGLRLFTDLNDNYSRDYHGLLPDGSEIPTINVFTRRDGVVRQFWSGEMSEGDPGQDPRGAPDLAPLWTVLDMTPQGRDPEWYPKLDYK